MAVVVAVDGGGTRCRLAVYDQDGNQLARTEVDGPGSLSLGVRAAWAHIEQGIRSLGVLLKAEPGWQPDFLVMGLAGSLQIERRREFLSLIPRAIHCTVVTDGHAQLMGASGGQPGICLAVGTGSVLHWLDNTGNSGMAGGWGFPVGDEGSGAWLGMRLVQRYIWHRDGRQYASTLMPAIEQRIGSTVSEIQLWTTQSQSSVLAQLAPMVFEHASLGDELAQSLLDEAAERCMALIHLAPAELPVYVVGGVGEQLGSRLRASLNGRMARAKGDALHGLWQLSRAGS